MRRETDIEIAALSLDGFPADALDLAESQAMAEDKMALIDGLAKPVDGLALLSEEIGRASCRERVYSSV